MKVKLLLAALIITGMSVQCTDKRDIIEENIENAKAQLDYLIKASEANDTLRIPSTFRNGEIDFVPTDDWVSGFFAGTLWYMYELTGEEYYAEQAQKHTEILHDIQFLKWHHDVGFMVYDSYGNGLRLKNIEGYDTVLVNTAKSLATRFRPNAGIIQSWNVDRGWQSERGWKCPVIIDNMMNLELFFKVSEMTGDPVYKEIAMSHADKTLANHYRDDFSTYHVVDYDDETGEIRRKCTAQGIADESRWARGQAWSIYGFTVAYRFTGEERYLQRAKDVANYLLVEEDNMPEDLVPYWDYDVKEFGKEMGEDYLAKYGEIRDVSSAAIVASALYELHWMTKDDFYKQKADKMIESLSTPAYRAKVGENGGFILMHSVGSIPHGGNIDVPLNYADYYFLEALIRKGRIEKGENPVR
ncbi:MAG: glycoside hydrolase family 88 protein [Bacteroidales bacterium]|nr:glycoside hydrolase family 88 protein [Bacteroidales bacterium]